MSFADEIAQWPENRVRDLIASATPRDVDRALATDERGPSELAALVSPHARPRIENLAREAQRLTRWHFGRTISLYAPLYLSNVCVADCVYCGYSVHAKTTQKRLTLKPGAIRRECEALANEGFQHVLLLTGEAPRVVPVSYLAEAAAIAREYFSAVSMEIYSMEENDYRRMFDAGVEGVTIYMETYHRSTYAQVHLVGDKANYDYRLDALERAGHAGARTVTAGVLLGLFDWQVDAFWLGLHARYLQRTCWQASVNLSFPRLLHVPERYHIANRVSDTELVQMMLAMRLFLPEAGFNLSTRERPTFRDKLIPLGVTSMSAGSSTRPGGYATTGGETLEQFALEDFRRPAQVARAIRSAGYDPVWKDFDHAFDEV